MEPDHLFWPRGHEAVLARRVMGVVNEHCNDVGPHRSHYWRVVHGPGVKFEDTGYKWCDGGALVS